MRIASTIPGSHCLGEVLGTNEARSNNSGGYIGGSYNVMNA